MKLSRKAGILGLVALASIANSAFAQEYVPSGWYLGEGAGKSRARIDDPRISQSLVDDGFAVQSLANDDRSGALKAYLGFQMNKYFAIEGGYFDLGNFGYVATTVPAGSLTGRTKMRGVNLDLVGTLPITERFSAFGRIGVTRAEARDTFRGTGMVQVNNPNPQERANNLKAGVGLQYAVTDALSARLELERYHINDAVGNRGDIDTLTFGLVYRFGAHKAAPVVVQVPVQVSPTAPALIPPPPLPPPPPAVVAEKVTFASDAFFDFDKAVLKPEGQASLKALTVKMSGMNPEVIIAVGHTDSVGTDAYNERLSIRRARAVKAYLVQLGVEDGRVYTDGKGESAPVADNKTAAGRAENRRVVVEVVGTPKQ